MKIRYLVAFLLILIIPTACGVQPSPAIEPEVTDKSTDVQESNDTLNEPLQPVDTTTPNCLGDEISPIGQSIADDYESVSYEQVMSWFCNGAEFEDILVALETESQTDATADEMLQMVAEGYTWEEIWQFVGLTD